MFTMMGERGRMELSRDPKHCEFLNEVDNCVKDTRGKFYSAFVCGSCNVLVLLCWFELI